MQQSFAGNESGSVQSRYSSLTVGDDVETTTEKRQDQPMVPWSLRLNQYVHLALFGMVGCWMRIRFEVVVQVAGLAYKESSLFVDLVGNMVGSFVIGALSTSAALGRPGRNLAAFPKSWIAVQDNAELQLGMRTGFCG